MASLSEQALSYQRFLTDGTNPELVAEIIQLFITYEKKFSQQLSLMRNIVQRLNPQAPYIRYGGAVPFDIGFYCHSTDEPTLLSAILETLSVRSGFVVDNTRQIVLAHPDTLIPVVTIYTSVLKSETATRPSRNHPGVILYRTSAEIIEAIDKTGMRSADLIKFLLAEGTGNR